MPKKQSPKRQYQMTDPDGESNVRRAEWAQAAVDGFQSACRTDDEDVISDLLCDLMHLCRQNPTRYGAFPICLLRAEDHYAFEAHHAGVLV